MNKLMIVTMLFFLSANVFAGDGFDKLYSKYSGSKSITSINLTQGMLNMVSQFVGDKDEEAKELLKSVDAVKLLMSEKTNPSLAADAKSMMKSGNYEDLMKVNSDGDNVRIMVKESGEIIKDVIVFVESEDDFVLINITGDIDPNQIGKVLNTLDIKVDGLDIH